MRLEGNGDNEHGMIFFSFTLLTVLFYLATCWPHVNFTSEQKHTSKLDLPNDSFYVSHPLSLSLCCVFSFGSLMLTLFALAIELRTR